MSSLFVYDRSSPELPLKVLNHFEDIAATLAAHGVTFERWTVDARVMPGADHEQVLASCQAPLQRLEHERGFSAREVISLDHPPHRDHPRHDGLARRREAYRHDYAVAHWFVAGRGLVYLQLAESVYAVLCEKHDLLTLPAGTVQWLDAGEAPALVALCLADPRHESEPVATADGIASRFAHLEY